MSARQNSHGRTVRRRTRFTRQIFESAGGDWESAAEMNGALDNIAAERSEVLKVEGALAKSKVAWKYAALRMAIVYRLVDLGEATVREWCDDNCLSAVVLARAFFETVALLHYVVERAVSALTANDLSLLDEIVMKATFGTKNSDYLKDDPALLTATNVMTLVDTLEKAIEGAKGQYHRLSDMAHPASFGLHQFYADINYETGTTNFSRNKRKRSDVLPTLQASLYGALWAERKLTELSMAIERIAELQPG